MPIFRQICSNLYGVEDSHCLGPRAALENMFAWVIVAYLQTLWAHLCFWGVFFGRIWFKVTFKLNFSSLM